MLTIKDAILLSRELHGNQPRRGVEGTYWKHPIQVHRILTDAYPCISNDAQVTALLHDTVEDGRCTMQDLRSRGATEVTIKYLTVLTRLEGESSQEHFDRVLKDGNADVLMVKWADSAHNVIWEEQDKLWNNRWELEQVKYAIRAETISGSIDSRDDWDIDAWESSFKGESQ